jgi:hypothetical protein
LRGEGGSNTQAAILSTLQYITGVAASTLHLSNISSLLVMCDPSEKHSVCGLCCKVFLSDAVNAIFREKKVRLMGREIRYFVRILFTRQHRYANDPQRYVTLTLSLSLRKAVAQFRCTGDSLVIYPHGQQRPRFSPRAVYVGTVVNEVALGQTFLLVRLASTVNYYSSNASNLFTSRPIIRINGSTETLSQNIPRVINKTEWNT